MNHKRRDFLRLSGNLALGLAIAPTACKLMSKEEEETAKALSKFGLQLYTLRDDLPKDPQGILKQVASFGYKQIEGYEGPQGLFWSMTNTDFKKYMDDLGMEFISSHCDINKDFEKKAAEAAAIGMKYLICPYKGAQKSLDDYKKIADEFNAKGEICKKNGIRFAYHNHDYTFKQQEGQFPQDVLMKGTDPALVDFEMDIYWVVAAGQDPEEWLKKYKDRFRACHVKDRTKNATEAADTCTLGMGSIDFAKILKTAKKTGMQYYIVEQEKYAGTTPLEATKDDAEYMKKLKF
ncbi:MAG: sugar phosphate isomerase/epimerase [Chitinophagaceae bacterium]|jgi:sugar phosphate isomerase/epimerase|nr:sugar phosphate isomerase/epimerase [Sphingobacteriales bacterium]OJW01151.1 MAG: sugar phosphate isomerase [Sphingobacteriales bacterium 44-61]TXJ29507.1 MAG: sugar phosphate isomerase/epimerase [Chitinophagaceae bacterium]